MPIKITFKNSVKEAAKPKKEKILVHGVVRSYKPNTFNRPLCGENSWTMTYYPNKITCPKCLVILDENLENGKWSINKSNEITYSDEYVQKIYFAWTENPVEQDYENNLNAKFDYISTEEPKGTHNYGIEIVTFPMQKGDKVFVAWQSYSVNDSYGMTTGQFRFVGAFKTEQEAQASFTEENDEVEVIESSHVEETIVR